MSIYLTGKLVRLRAVNRRCGNYFEWENNTDIWLISTTLAPFSKDEIIRYVKTANRDIFAMRQLRLMIETNDNQAVTIGSVDLFDFDPQHQRAGVGILIAADENRRKGYASEALKLLINYSFDVLLLKQLYCTIPADNESSIKLFESLGFVTCGRKRQWLRTKTGWIDEILMQLINPTELKGGALSKALH